MNRRANIVSGDVNGGNKTSANTGKTNTDLMAAQAVYEGTVLAVDLELRTLVVDTGAVTLHSCEYLPCAVAGLLGFSVSTLPPVGTRVVVLRGRSQNYVIAAQRATDTKVPDTTGFVSYAEGADGWEEEAFQIDRNSAGTQQGAGTHEPVDVFPGEYDLSNSMGVALRALHNFAALTAGDAAKVETHLFNAMVRIVSGYFVHHSVGGDTMIWSNGRCNKEEHFTSYQHEADSKAEEDATFASGGEYANTYDPVKSCDDPVNDTGRWRLSRYTGFLGDLIHTFVSTPTKMITTYNSEALRDGQFRASVGADGTLAIQAHGGVFVQVVPRVQVPIMFHKWDDPEFDAEEAIKGLNAEYLKLWDKGPNWENLEYACWQMRSYMRYIMQYHSLARFLQLQEKGLCRVPIDSEVAGHSSSDEQDKKGVNGGDASYPYLREASLSIDPSGSITLESNQHASVILNQGNVQIAAAGNIELKAGGTVSIQGRDMSLLSASDMEIVSMAGKIAMKAHTAWKVLCEMGRIWLKSDAQKPEGDPITTTIAEEVESIQEMDTSAIILDAPNAGILAGARTDVVIGSIQGDLALSAPLGNLKLFSDSIKAVVTGATVIKSALFAVVSKAAAIKAPALQLTEHLCVTAGAVVTDVVTYCKGLISTGPVVSPKSQKQLVPSDVDPPDVKNEVAMTLAQAADALLEEDVFTDFAGDEGELSGAVFALRSWTDVIATDKKQTESLKASPVDDYYANAGMPHMSEVPEQYTKLREAERTVPCPVWPGTLRDAALFTWVDATAPPLDQPLGVEYPGPSGEGDLTAEKYLYLVRDPKKEYPFDSKGIGHS